MSAAELDSLASKLSSTLTIHAEACGDSGPAVTLQLGGLAAVTPNAIKGASVGIVYDAVMELHLREGHPEHPDRVRVLNSRLQKDGLVDRCHRLTPKLASDEELLMCHSKEHIQRVDGLYMNPIQIADGQPAEQEGDAYIISGDIFCNRHTSTAARSAAGCAAQAVRAVLSGNVSTAFAVVRPPGHHAESNELQGFCFFNNVAVAAHAALQQPGLERVLIFDWDIHHGNGTQEIFFGDKRVLCISIHRRDGNFYPAGCGFAAEVGSGEGIGFNVNVPWSSKGMADADYLAAYDLLLNPIIQQFNPQLVLISAGFDAVDQDLLGGCHVTPAGFAAMTERLLRHAGGKVAAVLEGGYVPGLVGDCASAVMKVLLGDTAASLSEPTSYKLHRTTKQVLKTVDTVQRQYWPQLAALQPIETRYTEYAAVMKRQLLALEITTPLLPLSLAEAALGRKTRAKTAAAARTAVAVATPIVPATEPLPARTVARTGVAAEGSSVIKAPTPAVVADLTSLLQSMSMSENGLDRAQSAPPAAEATNETAAPEAGVIMQTAVASDLEKLASPKAPKRITIKKKGKTAAAATQVVAAAAAPPAQSAASTESMQASSSSYVCSTEQTVPHVNQLSTQPPRAAAEQQLGSTPAAAADTWVHVNRTNNVPSASSPAAAAAAVQPEVAGGLGDAGAAPVAGPAAAESESPDPAAVCTPAAVVASGVNGATELLYAGEEEQQQQQQQQDSPTQARRGQKSPRKSPRVKQGMITTPNAARHATTAEHVLGSSAVPSTSVPHWQQQQSSSVTPTELGQAECDTLVVQQVCRTVETAAAGEAAGQTPASPAQTTTAVAVDDVAAAEVQSQATSTQPVGGPWLLESPVKNAVGVGQWLLRLVRSGVGPDAQQQQQEDVREAASTPLPDDA